MLFRSRWSYARLQSDKRLIEIAEKKVISNFASTGVFLFRSAREFVESAEWALRLNMTFEGDFYISAALNHLVMSGSLVMGFPLPRGGNFVPALMPVDLV